MGPIQGEAIAVSLDDESLERAKSLIESDEPIVDDVPVTLVALDCEWNISFPDWKHK